MDSVSARLLDKRYTITNVLVDRPHERLYDARHVELDIPVRIVALTLPAGAPASQIAPDSSGRASPAGDASAAHLWALAARATNLRHPSLVRVRDGFRHRRTFYVVMERVRGESLADRIARRGQLSLRECLTYGLQLCDLLAYIGREGAALSPFLSISPHSLVVLDDDRIVLTDLGAGHWVRGAEEMRTGDRLPFLAPEALVGVAPDVRADVYSVAASLYTALAGEPPAPLGLGLLPLSMLAPLAPAALCATIERALQPDPAARYATPEDFGRALGRAVRATLPEVVALARRPRRSTSLTIERALASAQSAVSASSATAPARERQREGAHRWTRHWAQELTRVTAPRPLRRTGERALAAISSALRLGA